MPPEFLHYLKDLIEGRDVATWQVWWKTHDSELKRLLPRQKYLRLKFGKLTAAADILKESGIAFSWSPQGRQQAVLADLHPDAVDANGNPRHVVREEAYGGALAAFVDGRPEEGNKRIMAFLERLWQSPDEMLRAQELSDLEYDSEQLWQEGQVDAAIAILQAVAAWETDSDLEMPAVRFARKKLDEIGLREELS